MVVKQLGPYEEERGGLFWSGVLRSEFILVTGDLISNLDLVPFLQKHRGQIIIIGYFACS